jgi:hypothetical protein
VIQPGILLLLHSLLGWRCSPMLYDKKTLKSHVSNGKEVVIAPFWFFSAKHPRYAVEKLVNLRRKLGKGGRESNGRVEQTKVKHTHSGDALRHPVNINLNTNYENQDCKNRHSVCLGER